VALEEALIYNEPFATCAAFESWLLALSCLTVAPTQKINGIAEATVLKTENGLG
jgi:hypothetical protein